MQKLKYIAQDTISLCVGFVFIASRLTREYSFMQGQPHQFKSPVFHWELDCESVLVLVAKLCLTLLRQHGL